MNEDQLDVNLNLLPSSSGQDLNSLVEALKGITNTLRDAGSINTNVASSAINHAATPKSIILPEGIAASKASAAETASIDDPNTANTRQMSQSLLLLLRHFDEYWQY